MKVIHSLLLGTVFFSCVQSQDLSSVNWEEPPTASNGKGWTTRQLDLTVDISQPENPVFEAVMKLELTGAPESYGPWLVLNSFQDVMKFDSIHAPGHAPLMNQKIDNSEVVVTQVQSDQLYEKGDTLVIYQKLARANRSGLLFNWQKNFVAVSWPLAWYPTPLGAQKKAFWQLMKPRGKLMIIMPENWTGMAGGELVNTTYSEGKKTQTFQYSGDVARSFAAANFRIDSTVFDGKRMDIYGLTQRSKGRDQVSLKFLQSLKTLESYFGPAPYSYKGIVEVPYEIPGFYGASDQQYILLKTQAFDDPLEGIPVLAHEAAHAWWATLVNAVYEDPGGLWITESLAQYSAYLALEKIYGERVATDFIKTGKGGFSQNHDAAAYFRMIREDRDHILIEPSDGDKDFHYLADNKGTWIYHMLRHEMGDESFFQAIRYIIDQFGNKTVTLEQWEAAFKSHSQVPLETFFDQWLRRKGAPIVTSKVENQLVVLKQENDTPYELLIELDLYDKYGVKHEWKGRMTSGELTIPFEFEVDRIEIDPNDKLLIWKPEYGEKPGSI